MSINKTREELVKMYHLCLKYPKYKLNGDNVLYTQEKEYFTNGL